MQEIIPMSFTEIKAMVNAILEWLMQFVAAVENMFGGIEYGFAGYETTTAAPEEEEINLPL